jgi:hypothetical protein
MGMAFEEKCDWSEVVPEPTTMALFGLGLLGAAGGLLRRKPA